MTRPLNTLRHAARLLVALSALLLIPACGGGAKAVLLAGAQFPNFLADGEIVNTLTGASTSERARVCCSGLDVYVVWNDDRSGTDAIFFNVSRDGGRTWGAADVRLSTGDGDVGQPEICCHGDRVYVVWNDDRNDPGGDDGVFVNVSTDRGATWLAQDIQVDDGPGDCDFISICCDGLRVYLAWEDDRNGAGRHDIFANASGDGGLTWQPTDRRLNSNPPGLTRSRTPHVCCEGASVFVVWTSERDGDEEDIYVNYSVDGGANWLAADVRIDGSPPGTSDSERPRICCDLPYVYIAWEDKLAGADEEDIYFDYSVDGGVTWQANDIRVDTDPPDAGDSEDIDIHCVGTEVALVWRDDRGGSSDIYFSRSVDAGATWLAQDVRLSSNGAGASDSGSPRIGRNGSSLYVAYLDDRGGSSAPWFTYSTDNGASWDPGFPVNADPSSGDAADLDLCHDGERIYVVWSQLRSGTREVVVNGSIP